MCKFLCRLSFSFILFISYANISYAQLQPVKWTFEVEKVSADEYDLIITADIERGWSVYSQYLDAQQGPIPTSFIFDENANIQFIGETKELGNKHESYDETFGIKLVKFSRKARFVQRVRVYQDTDVVKGTLTYMTCDDTTCLPPEDVSFMIALNDE